MHTYMVCATFSARDLFQRRFVLTAESAIGKCSHTARLYWTGWHAGWYSLLFSYQLSLALLAVKIAFWTCIPAGTTIVCSALPNDTCAKLVTDVGD